MVGAALLLVAGWGALLLVAGWGDAAGGEEFKTEAIGATGAMLNESGFAAANSVARGADAAAAEGRAGSGRGHSVAANVTCFTSPSRSRFCPRDAWLTCNLLSSAALAGAAAADEGGDTAEEAVGSDLQALARTPSCFFPPRDLIGTGGGGMALET